MRQKAAWRTHETNQERTDSILMKMAEGSVDLYLLPSFPMRRASGHNKGAKCTDPNLVSLLLNVVGRGRWGQRSQFRRRDPSRKAFADVLANGLPIFHVIAVPIRAMAPAITARSTPRLIAKRYLLDIGCLFHSSMLQVG